MTAPLRFLHLGDLHLGPNTRNADRIRALDQIITEGLAMPLAAWLWPGDLNNSLMSVFDKNILTGRVVTMANHAPLVVVYGNHDVPGDLDFLAKLGAVYPIYVVAEPMVLRVTLAEVAGAGFHRARDEAAIFCLPYPTRQGLVAAGIPSDQVVAAARQALEYLFIDAAAQLTAATEAGCVPLMIGHLNVGGSKTSSGQPNIGREIELDPTMLDRLGPIYKGLNHIHKAQEIGGAHYAGSCCRLDWGEIEEKRYLVIEYTCVGPRLVVGEHEWRYTVTSHPIDVAPMYHVDGLLSPSGFSWHLGADVEIPASWEGCEVRVRFHYTAAERDLLDFGLVKEPFAGAKRIDTDPIPMHTRALRAPEVAAAMTLEAKVEAFTIGTGEAWTPALAQKLAQMQQAPDGATFFNDVAAAIAAVVDDEATAEPELDEVLS